MPYCVNCGQQLEDSMKFCPNCGNRIERLNPVYADSADYVYVAPEILNPSVEAASPEPEKTEEEKRADGMKSAYKRTGLGLVALYGIMSVIASEILAVLAAVGVGILSMDVVLTDDIFDVLVGTAMEELYPYIQVGSVIGTGVGLIIGILLFRKIARGKRILTPVEKKNLSAGQFLFVILLSLGLLAAGVFVGNFPSMLYLIESTTDSMSMPLWASIVVIAYAIIGAPILEEIALRKVLMDSLNGFGEVTAVFTSAMFFGLIHGNSMQFFLAFNVGLLFAVVYQKTGKVVYTMVMHAIINTAASVTEIAYLCGVNDRILNIVDYSILGAALVLGIVMILTGRKSEVLKIKRSDIPDANRLAFKNVGVKIAAIAGMVLLAINDLTIILGDVIIKITDNVSFSDASPLGLFRYPVALIPTVLAILTCIFVMKYVGRRNDPKPEAPEAETF